MGCILAVLFIIFVYVLSWIATCGLIKLITLCFGWAFSWAIATGIWLVIATGIWLVILILKNIFYDGSSK